MHERTTAQTQYLDVIAHFRSRQGEECGREKHGLVIGMGDEKADTLVAETWERKSYDLRGVYPCCCQNYGDGESEVEVHAVVLNVKNLWSMIGSPSFSLMLS